MSKKRKYITDIILIIAIIFVAVMLFFVVRNKEQPKKDNNEQVVSSEVSSTINIEDINSNEKSDDTISSEIEFLQPDETKADKILEDKKNNKNNSSVSKPTETASKTEIQTSKPATGSSESNTFEDGKKELENRALQYLIEHNIDIKTAGETGELCQHCGKKIWNPDKYGPFIPGMPEDYEYSGYCLGTCGISFD